MLITTVFWVILFILLEFEGIYSNSEAMTKYIVVKCRNSYFKLYEDVTKTAKAFPKKHRPPIPPYQLHSLDPNRQDNHMDICVCGETY